MASPHRALAVVLLIHATVSLAQTDAGAPAETPSEPPKKIELAEANAVLDEGVLGCDWRPRNLQWAFQHGATVKRSREHEHKLLDTALWKASVYGRSCLEAFTLLLEHGADPNAWVPDTYPLARAKSLKEPKLVALLEKAGAIEYEKVFPDCDAARAKVNDPNRFFRAYARYMLRQRCEEWTLSGGRYIGADIARVREAPSSTAAILELRRINQKVVTSGEEVETWSALEGGGWIAIEALRTTETTADEARSALKAAVAASDKAAAGQWADRLRVLSPTASEDLIRVIEAYALAEQPAKAEAATAVLKGAARVYLAMCAHGQATVLATFSRAEGLRAVNKGLKSLGGWIGSANWFGIPWTFQGTDGAPPTALFNDSLGEYAEATRKAQTHNEDIVGFFVHPEQIKLQGVHCLSSSNPVVLATAPFERVSAVHPKPSRMMPRAETISLKLGDEVHPLAFESKSQKSRTGQTHFVRITHVGAKSTKVDVPIFTFEEGITP